MSELTIESLGLSRDEILDRVVTKITDDLLVRWRTDDDGEESGGPTAFKRRLEKRVMERIDRVINDLAATHVLPNVAHYVETLVLTETNKWGEQKGRALTFIEYLVERAEHYLTEKVNFDGKDQKESQSYGWSATQTRVAWLVHKHLQYSIQTAMEGALKDANAQIVGGIEEAVKIKLGQILASLKVKAEIGR